MFIVGLTGSIAMGKSETARMFRENGIPVFDADKTVHALYGTGGEAVELVGELFPGTVFNGEVDRGALSKLVLGDKSALKKLEALVHPLVQSARQEFLNRSRDHGETLVVLDIPLLFETGGADLVDYVVVVSAPPDVQKERALERPGMSLQKFKQILTKQVPDRIKREKADFIVDSSKGLAAANQQVCDIISTLRAKLQEAK